MNQLYHPERAAQFFEFLNDLRIPTFVVTKNVVKDLTTFDDSRQETLDGVTEFLSANELDGEFLLECAKAHYLSAYSPPRKAFDYYSALALATWLREGHNHEGLQAHAGVMYYSNVYGITYISTSNTWDETRAEYSQTANMADQPGDSDFLRKKKTLYRKEIEILRNIAFIGKLEGVYDVQFEHSATGRLKVSESTAEEVGDGRKKWKRAFKVMQVGPLPITTHFLLFFTPNSISHSNPTAFMRASPRALPSHYHHPPQNIWASQLPQLFQTNEQD